MRANCMAILATVLAAAQPCFAPPITKVILGQVLITDSRFVVPKQYRTDFLFAISDAGVPYDIGCRLIWEESRWINGSNLNPNGTHDYGLMRLNSAYINDDYAWRYNNDHHIDPMNPAINMLVGMRKLAALHREYGTWRKAVIAWNCGHVENAPERSLELAERVVRGVK